MLTGQQAATAHPAQKQDELPASLTDDAFLGGRINVLQPEKGYRAGIDAVFLAATIPIKSGQTALEAGLGVGVASLCVAARVPDVHITGVEIAPRYAIVAEENIRRNGLGANIQVITGDVKEATRKDLTQWPPAESFNHVYANPPFFDDDKVRKSPVSLRNTARSFGPDDLEKWIKVMTALTVPRGSVTIVHRAESLGRLLAAFADCRIGGVHAAPLYAREGYPASRVIVQGIKGSRAPMQLLRGVLLHDQTNAFTAPAASILRQGAALALR